MRVANRIAIGFGSIVLVAVVLSAGGLRGMVGSRDEHLAALARNDAELAGVRGQRYALLEAGQGGPALAALEARAAKLRAARSELLAQSDAAAWARQKVLWGVLAVLALGIAAFARYLTRSITRPMEKLRRIALAIAAGRLGGAQGGKGSDEIGELMHAVRDMDAALVGTVQAVGGAAGAVAASAAALAEGNADLSSRTESQASSLEETAASMADLTDAVRRNASHAADAARLVGGVQQAVAQGGDEVQRAVATMHAIKAGAADVAAITGVIDGIAFQTNILALNAAVEAARAGEEGRGFAVVAGEVRSLAQRAAAAAHEIRDLVAASGEQVDMGVDLVEQAGAAMAGVAQEVARIGAILQQIQAESAQQSERIVQANDTVAMIDDATQRNAALVEQAAAASASMQEQAAALLAAARAFKLEGHAA